MSNTLCWYVLILIAFSICALWCTLHFALNMQTKYSNGFLCSSNLVSTLSNDLTQMNNEFKFSRHRNYIRYKLYRSIPIKFHNRKLIHKPNSSLQSDRSRNKIKQKIYNITDDLVTVVLFRSQNKFAVKNSKQKWRWCINSRLERRILLLQTIHKWIFGKMCYLRKTAAGQNETTCCYSNAITDMSR